MLKLKNIFWLYLSHNFTINDINGFRKVEPSLKCSFVPITLNNYHRVKDFREEGRILQYKDKLHQNEIGFFAECNGTMIGSIWSTINHTAAPIVVRTFNELLPNEGLIHDIVTGEKYRGMSVGPFMVSNFAQVLLSEYGLRRIIIDVNFKNRASLRMMEKAGLRLDYRMLSVSLSGKMILSLMLKRYV